jgi:hypothetical protein
MWGLWVPKNAEFNVDLKNNAPKMSYELFDTHHVRSIEIFFCRFRLFHIKMNLLQVDYHETNFFSLKINTP